MQVPTLTCLNLPTGKLIASRLGVQQWKHPMVDEHPLDFIMMMSLGTMCCGDRFMHSCPQTPPFHEEKWSGEPN